MPAAKLMPPMHSMKMRKPVELNERCGVMIAEKIAGSAGGSLVSSAMAAIIPARWRAKHPRKRSLSKA